MKTFIKWLAIFFLIAEILSAVGICFGILLKSLALKGAVEMLTLGFSSLAFIFLFRSVTPFYKRYVSTSPAVNENFPLVIRRLLYFSMVLYSFALAFLSGQLTGTAEMMLLGLSFSTVTGIVAVVSWVMKNERREVLQEPMIRMVCLFIVHLIL